jgi:hypothetical protein
MDISSRKENVAGTSPNWRFTSLGTYSNNMAKFPISMLEYLGLSEDALLFYKWKIH